MNIFVGNLAANTSEAQVNELFKQFGEVNAVRIVTDRNKGLSHGFGFVEMENETDGNKAIEKLNNTKFQNKKLEVSEAMG